MNRSGPLSGLRVLDLTQTLAGPFGAQIMGDLGAEVIKIEGPDRGDPLRAPVPRSLNGESAIFLSVNRNKRGLTINLKSQKGREIFYELVKKADVVFDNFRPGVVAELGINYEVLKEYNPRIICCSLSSYGATGPYSHKPGYDYIIQGICGAMSVTGPPDGPPSRMGLPVMDLGGGLMAMGAIMAALYARERTGLGQKIDLSLLDLGISFLTYLATNYFTFGEVPRQIKNSSNPYNIPQQVFGTSNGYIVVVAYTDRFFERLCDVLGSPDLARDERFNSLPARYRNQEELIPKLQAILATKTSEEWLALLDKAAVPAGPVNTVDKALADPQVLERKMVISQDHPRAGTIKLPGNPVKMAGVAEGEFLPAPGLGEHTAEILSELLGYSAQQIQGLRRDGVV